MHLRSIIASAVILPETESPTSLKRRQSSVSEVSSKRPRINDGGATDQDSSAPVPPSDKPDTARSSRLGTDKAEERKRGRRLFGALLGTLSQSSSSTAQTRRTEIERKQQAKLRHQDEQQDEAQKEKLEALTRARRKEQATYAKQSVCLPSSGSAVLREVVSRGADSSSADENPPLKFTGRSPLPSH